MNKFLREKAWSRTLVISSAFFGFLLGGKNIAVSKSAIINSALNVETTKLVDTGEDVGDTEYFKSDYKDTESLKKYCDSVGEEIETEGLVLLKNENHALPLNGNESVSLLAQGAVKFNYSTSGSSATSGVTYPTLGETMSNAGFNVNQTALDFYTSGNGSKYGRELKLSKKYGVQVYKVKECPWSEYDDTTKTSIATYGDAAIVTFCRDSGEGQDVSAYYSDGEDGSYLSLTENERSLLAGLKEMKDQGQVKKIIVLLNMAVPMTTGFLTDDSLGIDAAMWIGNVGTCGMYGVVDVLKGANPSGHLNDTFLKDNFASPAMATWKNNSSNSFASTYANADDYALNNSQKYYSVYQEGIYVGYKYYETRYADTITQRSGVGSYNYDDVVAYPFGYGLSYGSFSYSDFSVTESSDKKSYEVKVTVNNTDSTYDGKDVVEIYLQKPYTSYDEEHGVEKSAVELVAYKKTGVIKHGEHEEVTLKVSKEDFKSYDADGAKGYILDAGKYYLSVGSDAHDANKNILAASGYATVNGNASLAAVALDLNELDTTTYHNSVETGKEITNQLDFMDMNRYENRGDNSVQYVSRKNWEGTWPTEEVKFSVSGDKMNYDLSSSKPLPTECDKGEIKYSQQNNLSLIQLRSTEETEIKYDDELWDSLLDEMSYDEQAILMSNAGFNTDGVASVSKPQTKDYDGPTGITKTTTGTVMPSLGIWAASFNDELVKKVGDALAEDVRACGYHILYGPGVNLHRLPFGGRLNEYFSEDGVLTGLVCSAFVTGMQDKGVLCTIKHFAFNNEDTCRNGISIWMNEQEARELMLRPFEIAMRPSMGHAHAIMTSFNRAGCIWTSASHEMMETIIRDEWDFDGYSLTDMADANGAAYMKYDDGIINGTDLFLGSGTAQSFDDYKDNLAFRWRMREACHRVLYTICNYSCAMNGYSSSTKVVKLTPWWETLINALLIADGVVIVGALALYITSLVFEKKEN